MIYLAIALLLLALLLLWISRKSQAQTGLPGGRVIYTDTRGWGKVEKPFYDAAVGLTGKPDYLVEEGSNIIPVEVKSTYQSETPYDSHIYQLAAYCLLVKQATGKRVPYGILHYPNRNYAIDYTPALENALLDLLARMRLHNERSEVARSHSIPARCMRCGYRAMCDQRL